jgi:uncharacterized protein YbjT (DUF2867 family)
MSRATLDLEPRQVVILGATGAVGGAVVRSLLAHQPAVPLTLLGRRTVGAHDAPGITQYAIDVFQPASYRSLIDGHQSAVCTLGVGEPSKASPEEFVRVDRDAVLAFAAACREQGVRHFELLGSVGANAQSRQFYLRTKGELEEGLRALSFDRLSLFRPSMIVTPTNRYGLSQAVTLAVWPWLGPLLQGPARKLRGVPLERLGAAMANNLFTAGQGTEVLYWDDFERLTRAREVRRSGP